MMRLGRLGTLAALLVSGLGFHPSTQADAADVRRLLDAYPEHLERIDGNALVWRDGTRMTIDDGRSGKGLEQMLDDPDIDDMLAIPYRQTPVPSVLPPAIDSDPGRVRHRAFFGKMYGDCANGTVAPNLVEITWMAGVKPQKLKVTRVNGVAEKLAAVSRDLEKLPADMHRHLVPSAGTYVCRPIAGTERTSPHGLGIAIDIAVPTSDYWRWSKEGPRGRPVYKNRIPIEIVDIFEKHGFVWGGRWFHYDTMHFEYRPELLPPGR